MIKGMEFMVNHPRLLCLFCLIGMWLMALLGAWIRAQFHVPEKEDKDNLTLVVSATLTLLGLIIGFTFSLATARYDQRRLYEEEEANAIGTEYVRSELFPAADSAHIQHLLDQYLERRITFYTTGYGTPLYTVDQMTARLQNELWAAIKPQAAAAPNPVTALVVSGMNDTLNSQGYTQFAWWNRIPTSAWWMLIGIAFFANLLVGYATKRSRSGTLLLSVLPVIASVSFFLIADIDSPRGGVIRIPPKDLISLAQSRHLPVPYEVK